MTEDFSDKEIAILKTELLILAEEYEISEVLRLVSQEQAELVA